MKVFILIVCLLLGQNTFAATCDEVRASQNSTAFVGIVSWYNTAKGIGRIYVPTLDKEVVVDFRDIIRDGFKVLQTNEQVSFLLCKGKARDGRSITQAVLVRPLVEAQNP